MLWERKPVGAACAACSFTLRFPFCDSLLERGERRGAFSTCSNDKVDKPPKA